MSTDELIAAYKALPPEARREVADAILMEDDFWIPKSFREGMEDAAAGRGVDLDVVINDLDSDTAKSNT